VIGVGHIIRRVLFIIDLHFAQLLDLSVLRVIRLSQSANAAIASLSFLRARLNGSVEPDEKALVSGTKKRPGCTPAPFNAE